MIIALWALWPSYSHAGSCATGKLTHFATSCANGWNKASRPNTVEIAPNQSIVGFSEENPYTAKDLMPWELSDRGRTRLNVSSCGDLKIITLRPEDHLAFVRCTRSSNTAWVNVDMLQCNSKNIAAIPQRHAGLKQYCPVCSSVGLAYGGSSAAGETATYLTETITPILTPLNEQIVAAAEDQVQAAQNSIKTDQLKLLASLPKLDAELHESMKSASKEIKKLKQRAQAKFGEHCNQSKGMNEVKAIQGMSTCRILNETDILFGKLFNEETKKGTSLRELLQSFSKEILSAQHIGQNSDIALRTLMFYSLTPKERERAADYLTFIRRNSDLGKSFYELHNGYVFGGIRQGESGNGTDCSAFIASVIAGQGTQTSTEIPTTQDFLEIYNHLSGGAKSPKWRHLASCFETVDLRAGEMPIPSDIVFTKNKTTDSFHAVIVKSYDADSGNITTYEAAGGRLNTMISRQLPLYEPACRHSSQNTIDPQDWAARPVRADVRVLRFRANPSKDCPFTSFGQALRQ